MSHNIARLKVQDFEQKNPQKCMYLYGSIYIWKIAILRVISGLNLEVIHFFSILCDYLKSYLVKSHLRNVHCTEKNDRRLHPNKSNAQVFLVPSRKNWSGIQCPRILEYCQLEFDPDKKHFAFNTVITQVAILKLFISNVLN